jgi:hypothetical protein
MGRAIVRQPQVFLFDEPLSNLDAKLRAQTRLEIQKLHRELGITSLFVTHDQVEAMTLAQRMIVMNAGRMEQFGTPEEVYHRPATHLRGQLHRLAADEPAARASPCPRWTTGPLLPGQRLPSEHRDQAHTGHRRTHRRVVGEPPRACGWAGGAAAAHVLQARGAAGAQATRTGTLPRGLLLDTLWTAAWTKPPRWAAWPLCATTHCGTRRASTQVKRTACAP